MRLRHEMRVLLAVGFSVVALGAFVGVYAYLQSLSDFHTGSCRSRLALRHVLIHAKEVTSKTPVSAAFTAKQKSDSLAFYDDELQLVDITDCADVTLPGP